MTSRIGMTPLAHYKAPLGQPGTGTQQRTDTAVAKYDGSTSAMSLMFGNNFGQRYTAPISLPGAQAYQKAIAQQKSQKTGGQIATYNIKRQNAPIQSYIASLPTEKYEFVPESLKTAVVLAGTENIKHTTWLGKTYKDPLLQYENFDTALTLTTRNLDDDGHDIGQKPSLSAAQQLHLAMPAINTAYQTAQTDSYSDKTLSLAGQLQTKYTDVDPVLLKKYVSIVLNQHPQGQPTYGGWGTPVPWTVDNIMDASLSGDFAQLGKGIKALDAVYKSKELAPYRAHETTYKPASASLDVAPESKSSDSMILAPKDAPGKPQSETKIVPQPSAVVMKDSRKTAPKLDPIPEDKAEPTRVLADDKADENSRLGLSRPPSVKLENKTENKSEEIIDESAEKGEKSWIRKKYHEIRKLERLKEKKETELKALENQNNESLNPDIEKLEKEIDNIQAKLNIIYTLKGLAVAGALSGLGTLGKELDEQEKKKKSKKKSKHDDDFNEDLFSNDTTDSEDTDDDFSDFKETKKKKSSDKQEKKSPSTKENKPIEQEESEIEQFFKSIQPVSAQGHVVSAKITTKSTLDTFVKNITTDIFVSLKITELLPPSLLMSIENDPEYMTIHNNAVTAAINKWLPPHFNEEKFEDWLLNLQEKLIDYIVKTIEKQTH